ncbi:MAG: peptidylprolyl isomerase [Candidatus Omnitrophica bacterium]|nr:peptidylprolyl isomerase [Candidatus Omnitrophota bacterium]
MKKRWITGICLISVILAGCGQVAADVVVLETTRGVIKIQLWPDIAPKACENFKGLARAGKYDGNIFHRVIPGFMIQGGDPTGTGRGGESIWGGPFKDEVSAAAAFDRPWLVAMANAGPHTNKSQFFITTGSPEWLNMKHTIFGEVIEGYEVVTRIEQTETDERDRPFEDQRIVRAYVE